MSASDSFIVDRGYDEFSSRPELNGHIARMAFKALAAKPLKSLIVDLSGERREMSAGMFLAAAIAISRRLRKIPSQRIGVVFPSGLAGSLTNLAAAMADKIPVNLNFATGRKSAELCIRKAGLTHIVSARPMMEKLPNFPWTDEVLDFADLMGQIGKAEILAWYAAVLCLPPRFLMRRLGLPNNGGDREAALLFSSGSTGEPKGVALSHRNIIANCLQIAQVRMFRPKTDIVMANLPIFHSFGFTVNVWYPMMAVMKTVCLPNPLETRRVAQAVQDEKVSFLIGTPTLLRPYLKKVDPEMLRTLRVTVAGAEKPPAGFAQLWEKTMGSPFVIGYGITETSPAVAVDLEPVNNGKASSYTESTGILFPGMQARIVDDATGQTIAPTSPGVLYLRGANVFKGYLGDLEATNRALDGDWFRTGDLARFDEHSNLHIEGRISRFSKIAGEMIPHGTVEQAIVSAYHLEESEVPMLAVAGARDDAKGESLVLLTVMDIDAATLREKLSAEGLPNLWIPRRIRRVETIPTLASGKLDLVALGDMARRAVEAEEEAV
ncbi:MAG: AMP-binding protein [Opitutales bacterium]|jgi:acyl-[acyl-carrier-protein]-phospholipid O-acyltransferase/long-chain-fatty-acid--[acyl-carrier-protein] ligase